MRNEAKGYFLKEYGSWSVLIISYLAGLGVSRTFSWAVIPLFIALCFLINSKQAFTKWIRRNEGSKAFSVFFGQIVAASVVLISIFGNEVTMLLPLLIFPAAYLLSIRLAGEHAATTELLGFSLLSLAAVLPKYLLTGGLDVRLFLGVVFYFTAGVFKIKALLLKKASYRILTVLFVFISLFVYRRMYIPAIILLPLIDNLVAAATLYRVRLKTTGWIELAKSLAFLALFLHYY
jgi:YwiC-like protein